MQCRYWMLPVAISCVAAMGCGSSGDGKPTAAEATSTQTGTETTSANEPGSSDSALSGPAAAVSEFLEAVRMGDDRKSEAMLTSAAREQIAKYNISVSPPRSDTASFKIGEVKMQSDDRATVVCTCSDRDATGQIRSDEVTWVLRLEPEGWRVGGMLVTVDPQEPPQPFNFEDLEDTFRRQRLLKEKMERRAAEARSQAQRPTPPESPDASIQR